MFNISYDIVDIRILMKMGVNIFLPSVLHSSSTAWPAASKMALDTPTNNRTVVSYALLRGTLAYFDNTV